MIKFIWHNPVNRRLLFSSLAISMTLWVLFKWLYPYPNSVLDSFYYVKAAVLSWDINAWPIGYSKFLQLFNLFSHSAIALVTIQYLLLQLSCLAFFFTWRYLFSPGKWTTIALFTSLFANPLFLYCSNFVLSDPLFICLSILWLTQLLWIIYRPRPYMAVTHALLLAMAFTVRYAALYYPIVAALVFLLSRQRAAVKLTGISLPLAFMLAFILYTSHRVGEVTGKDQFSAFGGWKIANDALYMYEHIYEEASSPVPEKFHALDSMTRKYFAAHRDTVDLLRPDYTSGSFFMFANGSPLVQYMFNLSDGRWRWPFLNSKEWLFVGPLYEEYGMYLVKEHPLAFARWFIYPNLIRYIHPPAEIFGAKMSFLFLDRYGGEYMSACLNLNNSGFSPEAVTLSRTIADLYSGILIAIHLGFIAGLLAFLAFGGFRRVPKPHTWCLVLMVALWFCDFTFSVFSAGIVLRYEIFIASMEIPAGLYFITYAYRHLDTARQPIPVT